MAGNHQFLSFLNRPSGSGDITLTLQSYISQSDSLITLSVTGLSAVSPHVNAFNATTQINTQLTQYGMQYTGAPSFSSISLLSAGPAQPTFSSQLGAGNFRIHQSDHVISFFSEAPFSLDVCSSVPGLQVICGNDPILATVDTARKYGPLSQFDMTGLGDAQIAILLELASTKLTTVLNNSIVVSTYIHSEVGYLQRSMFLREGLPGIYYDGVRIKRPYQIYSYPYIGASLNWNYNHDTGELYWIPSQNVIDMFDPTAPGNEIRISYVAGYFSIPNEIAYGVVTLMQAISENTANIESLKTGTWAVKFKSTVIADLISSLAGYVL